MIFVAELGDKSQLLAMTFAARYKALPVLISITLATAVMHAISVGIGAALGAQIPTRGITIVAGIAFLGFAVWTLRGDELSEEESSKAAQSNRTTIIATSVAFLLAELGDKTMFATITLATKEGLIGTWVGSTAGMVTADALAILVGYKLAARFADRTIKIAAALVFFVFGVIMLIEGIRG